jgi:hypothetical protein
MTIRWVNNAIKVLSEDCQSIGDFLKQCKKELSSKLGSYDVDQLSLSTTDGGTPLQPVLLRIWQRILYLSKNIIHYLHHRLEAIKDESLPWIGWPKSYFSNN